MSTYLQGVPDYIPQIQPYQPDLNLYNNLLQTKQTQYDSNWKALNKMYSTYYNAALTRDDTTKSRDQFIKQAEFNLQRISQLDLSLEQNVTQATQIFKPLYENKLLMKDMALTKNANYQKNIAASLQGSANKEDREMYWDKGVRAIDYQMQEFKNSTADEAMGFGNVKYTRFVNAAKEARKLAKEAGLNVEIPSFSEDGQWMIKTKNGEQLIEPLSRMFEAELGSDAAIQEVFKTEAYVARKDYAYSNASLFKGGESEAELKYLETQFTRLKEENQRKYQTLRDNSSVYDAKIADLKKQIENKNADPRVAQQLKAYEMNKDINDKVLNRLESELDDLDDDITNSSNPYGDVKTLRYKVDNAVATSLMQKTFDEAAEAYAMATLKQDIKANPYVVKQKDHQYRMAEIAARNSGLERAARIRNQGETEKALIEAGTHTRDQNGNLVPVEDLEIVRDVSVKSAGTTDEKNQRSASKSLSSMYTNDYALPYINNMVNVLSQLQKEGKISQNQINQILKYNDKTNVNLDQFAEQIKNNPDTYLRNKVGVDGLKKIKQNFDRFINNNATLSEFKSNNQSFNELVNTSVKLGDYYLYVEQDQKWRIESSKIVENRLKKAGFVYAHYLYDEKGRRRSEKEFYDAIPDSIKSKYIKAGGNTYVGGSPLTMGTTGKTISVKTGYQHELDYNEMVKAAAGVYSDSNIKMPSVPGIPGSGSGRSQLGTEKEITVNLKGDTSNKYRFKEILNDLSKFDFGNNNINHVSLQGATEYAYEQIRQGKNRNDIGQQTLDAIRREASKPKSKFGLFNVSVGAVTAGKSNQSYITIKPPVDWIKENTATIKEGKIIKPGIFTPNQAQAAIKDGITYMMDSKNMSNSIYKSYFYDPIAMYLNSNPQNTYELAYPSDPRFKIKISKNKMGQEGTFDIGGQYVTYDNGQEVVLDLPITTGVLGNNLVNTRDQMIREFIPQIQQMNINNFNYGGE